MDQIFKGDDINNIGLIQNLGKEIASDLKKLNYDDGGDQIPGESGGGEKKLNKFFQKQEDNRKRDELMRPDKHLLPVEEFNDPITGAVVVDDFDKLPFHTVDIIFNHKNIYANLQNSNPREILYEIHDMAKWLPLIRDPDIEHPRITLKKKIDAGEDIEPPTCQKKTDETKKKKKTVEKKEDPEIFKMKY